MYKKVDTSRMIRKMVPPLIDFEPGAPGPGGGDVGPELGQAADDAMVKVYWQPVLVESTVGGVAGKTGPPWAHVRVMMLTRGAGVHESPLCMDSTRPLAPPGSAVAEGVFVFHDAIDQGPPPWLLTCPKLDAFEGGIGAYVMVLQNPKKYE